MVVNENVDDNPVQSSSVDSVRRRRVLGAITSIVIGPGSGHILLGENKRALGWLAATMVLSLLLPYSPWIMLLAVLGTRIGSAVDLWWVSKSVKEVPEFGTATLRFIGFGALAMVLLVGVRITSAEAFKIPATSMEPTLRIGDHLFVKKLMAEPARGAVAVFVYPCEPNKDFVKRIVALAGDLVEIRCDKLYVNGEAVPSSALDSQCSYWDRGPVDWEERECSLFAESLGGHDYHVIHDRQGAAVGQSGALDFPGTSLPSCQNAPRGEARVESAQGSLVDAKNSSGGICDQQRAYKVPDGHFFVMGDNRANSSDSRIWGPVPNGNLRGIASYIWWSRQRDTVGWGRIGQSLK